MQSAQINLIDNSTQLIQNFPTHASYFSKATFSSAPFTFKSWWSQKKKQFECLNNLQQQNVLNLQLWILHHIQNADLSSCQSTIVHEKSRMENSENSEKMMMMQMRRLDASISSITISLTQLETFLNSFSVAPAQVYEAEHSNQAQARSQLGSRRPDFKNLKVDGEGVKIIKNAALSQRHSQQSPNYQERDFHSKKPSMSQTFNVWGDTVISHKSMEKLREQSNDRAKQYPIRPLRDRKLQQFLDGYSRIYEWLSNIKRASQLYNETFFSDITVNNHHFA